MLFEATCHVCGKKAVKIETIDGVDYPLCATHSANKMKNIRPMDIKEEGAA